MCVWVCVGVPTHQRWSTISWFNHHHQLQLITPPLNTHHFLISFVRSLFVSPGCVWSRLRSSLVPSSFLFVFLWICHVTSALLFTALVWPSKSPAPLPCYSLDCTYHHLYRFNKERAYSHTVSAFPSWHTKCIKHYITSRLVKRGFVKERQGLLMFCVWLEMGLFMNVHKTARLSECV